MKIFKKNEHALLIKPFGVKDSLYLATTILIFFDLENPDDPLTEQDLWSTMPEQIQGQGVLDMGMAKPRGEVLVTGSCHAPRGTKRTAAQVSLRVGALEKCLHVFGNRSWTLAGGVARVISDPEPFSEIPLVYENAFGGDGFDRNPLGRGVAPVLAPDGKTHHPLPNIENPDHLIASPADRPDPAGFGPLDLMWPQRAKKQGTYDKQWQQERWPHFPEDMDYEFFNTAPQDQFITGFFQGGEPVELVNMHPDIQCIRSHLPPLRLRCFVTKDPSLKPTEKQDEIFEEVPLRIDTLHLFPSILRGVAMYRGTTQILDDEYADVRRIFVATEKLAEEAKSLEFYLEQQKKALDRTVPIDRAPIEAGQKKIGEALKRIRSLPKEIQAARLKAMGKAPRMPAPTPAAMKGRADALIGKTLAIADRLEARASGMQAKWGHLAAIPLDRFDTVRAKVKQAGERIDEAEKELSRARERTDAFKQDLAAHLKTNVDAEDLAGAGIDPDNLLGPDAVNPWHDHGFPFVIRCRQALERDPDALEGLLRMGFKRSTIRRAWLGVHPQERCEDRTEWGLAPLEDGQGRPADLRLPTGLVLPRFDGAVLNRLVIRTQDVDGPGKEIPVDGSDKSPRFMPAACLVELPGMESAESAPCVRVADELQALLVEQEIGDACSVIALQTPGETPGEDAANALGKASVLLVVLPETGIDERSWADWQASFPKSQKLLLPHGETVFEARSKGTDIRSWIMEALPAAADGENQAMPHAAEAGKTPQKPPAAGSAKPPFNIKALVTGLKQEIRDFHQPKFDAIKKEQLVARDKAREAIVKAGGDPEHVLAASRQPAGMSLSESGGTLSRQIIAHRDALKRAGHLTPEMEVNMNTQADTVLHMGRAGDQRLLEGTTRLAAVRQKGEMLRAGILPDDFQARFQARGIDPEKMKKLTRDEVIERYTRKESLSGAVLNGVDLSELDLQGIDLSRAQCRRTRFCGTNLAGADLSRTLALEADFSGASLQGIQSQKGVFIKAVFEGADLNQAVLRMAVLREADLSKADLSRSNLHMTILQKAKLKQTDFSGAVISMSVFTGADASAASFSNARLTKCLFQKTGLDNVDFSGAVLDATMFYGVRGASVRFAGADLSRSRMGGQSVLGGADFSGTQMSRGCFRDSDLSGADFQGARIESSLLENCDLSGANLLKVSCIKTRLSKSNLEGADMRGVNLFLGSLRKVRLVNTDLRGANLFGVDFYKAVLGDTRLEDANLKMTLLQGRTEYLP